MFLIYTLFCNSVDVFLLYCHFYSIFFVSVLIEVEDCAKIIEHHERFWKICHHDLARILKLVSTLTHLNFQILPRTLKWGRQGGGSLQLPQNFSSP